MIWNDMFMFLNVGSVIERQKRSGVNDDSWDKFLAHLFEKRLRSINDKKKFFDVRYFSIHPLNESFNKKKIELNLNTVIDL